MKQIKANVIQIQELNTKVNKMMKELNIPESYPVSYVKRRVLSSLPF